MVEEAEGQGAWFGLVRRVAGTCESAALAVLYTIWIQARDIPLESLIGCSIEMRGVESPVCLARTVAHQD